MMSFTSGRTAAWSSIGAAELVVDAHHHHRVPLAVRLVEGLPHLGGQLDSLHLHEPLAAHAHRVAVDVHGDPVADLVLGLVGRRQRQVPAPAALCRIARAIGWWNFRSAAAA